ncbi:MAG: sugar ABC transporter ATP-binding protein [Alphaproteobacteria bacterium]
MEEKKPLLELKNIHKHFSGIYALKEANLTIYPGEVIALVGENGAGKSTCVKVMTGLYKPDVGQIFYKGKEIHFSNALDATQKGIAAIHQETVLFDDLNIAENIFMGHQIKNQYGLLDWPKMHEKSAEFLQQINLEVDTQILLKDLSLGKQHMVAIARALAQESDVVIMDEPTASLSFKEIEELYVIIEKLKAAGKGILFISHKFDEIFRIADRFVVYRDGAYVIDGDIKDVTQNKLVEYMVGREVKTVYPKPDVDLGEICLEAHHLSNGVEFDDISFHLKKREILGFYGLVGAGRSELMQAIMQLSSFKHSGKLIFEGENTVWTDTKDAITSGLVYIPEDRRYHGLITPMSIRDNMVLPSLKSLSYLRCFPSASKEKQLAEKYAAILKLKAAHLGQKVDELSGGNQQKVVLSRWLAVEPKVIIVDEPTRGIDIGAKASVYEVLSQMVASDLSILMVSSELPELMGMADRIIVMRYGRMVKAFERSDFDAQEIAAYATGAKIVEEV